MECSPESKTKEAAQLGETDGEGRGESKRLKEEKSVEAEEWGDGREICGLISPTESVAWANELPNARLSADYIYIY